MAMLNFCEINIVVVFLFFATFSSSQSQGQRLREVIEQLATSLPGCYNNARQYHSYSVSKIAPHRKRSHNLFLLRVELYKLHTPLFNDSLTIYFQDFTKNSKTPLSAGFYSFTPDYQTGSIWMRVYSFKEAFSGFRVPYSNYSIPEGSPEAQQLLSAFQNGRLKTNPSCDMVWSKTRDKTFTGTTRSECLDNLGEGSVRISVSMTLTGSKITLTEGWYNLGNRAKLEFPYVLNRRYHQPAEHAQSQSHDDDGDDAEHSPPQSQPLLEHHPQESSTSLRRNSGKDLKSYHSIRSLKTNDYSVRGNLRKHHELTSLKKNIYNRLKVETKSETDKETTSKQERRRRNKRRVTVLQKYRHIKASLFSGQRLFYKIDLSKCKVAAQVTINSWIFGGEITNFQIIREKRNRQRRTNIQFTNSRTSMTARGVETVRREIKLNQGGHVEVKVIKHMHGRRKRKRQYTFQCKLFSNNQRHGSVRMFTEQASPRKEAKSLTKISKSLDKGRSLWLVVDVTRCRGKGTETTVMAGGLISDYNMVNKGKTMQFFLPVDHIKPGVPQKSQTSGFVINIMKNNDVMLTWASTSNEKMRKFKFRPAYHCELSDRMSSMSNDMVSTESVKILIR